MVFYNVAQPLNISPSYGPYSQLDFLCKSYPGRQIQANSFRISGRIQVQKTLFGAPSTFVPVEPKDSIFLDPFCGVAGCWKNISTAVNDRIIENVTNVGRLTSMKNQALYTLEQLTASSHSASELKGLGNNVMLAAGGNTSSPGCPFSFKPMISINNSDNDLQQSKFPIIKVMTTLGSPLEALYCSASEPAAQSANLITGLTFTLYDVYLSWYETMEVVPIPRVVFKTNFLTTQTLNVLNATLSVSTSTPYSAIYASFIKQADRNKIYKNDNKCDYVPDLQRVEFTTNGISSPIKYAIGAGNSSVYPDVALNYLKALEGENKNSVLNKFLSETLTFGIGCAMEASINDRLNINLQINQNTLHNPSIFSSDVFIFTSGFVEV